jgi:hypothetical protein
MSKDKGKKKDEKPYSGIPAHKKQKNVLVPPMMAIPGISLQSWVNDRMPEMLWSALLISHLGRERALAKFREIAGLVPNLPEEKRAVQPTLSGLASLQLEMRQQFLSAICSDTDSKNAVRPLLLFEDLPARQDWANAIGEATTAEDWAPLETAVLQVLNHQSQEATDCRWLKVLFQILSGMMHLQTEEQVREILEYPNFGMPQKVRPTVRCMEGAIGPLSGQTSVWPQFFWDQCLRDTPCDARHTMETEWVPSITTTPTRVREVREALARHEKSSLKTTDVDARHDATFGFGAYALAILEELLSIGNSTSILGRIGLRTLLESYVTISHLKACDDPNLWMAYRQYGSGQAKLAFLKLGSPTGNVPMSVDVEVLNELANEDRWLEFVPIDLGHWAAKDLRKLSAETGLKPDYDRLYPWTSAFTHGNWAAVRNSCFDLCTNPLHRLHRSLRSDTADLGDVVEDASALVDKILGVVDSIYPGFAQRVTLPESRLGSGVAGGPTFAQSGGTLAPLTTVQREFFQVLDEFFRRATGCSAEEFAPLDSFTRRIKLDAHKIGPRAPQAYLYVHEALSVFYKRFGGHVFSEAKNLSGLKLVLGGAAHFGKSQFDSVRKMLLYADSILIPDPILPWVESPRIEEGFRKVRLLETAFILLHFKPLVDADLPSPPLVIFPSFEKSLEERDPTTQRQINLLVSRVLSYFLGRSFNNIEELQQFAAANEAEFLRKVDEQNLFVAPGGRVGQPLQAALEQYETEIKLWRSQSYQTAMKDVAKGFLVLNGLAERLVPQYHLLENAQELSACPLLALPAPWHYYSLISRFFAAQVQTHANLDLQATDLLDSTNGPQQSWLGDIPVIEVVDLLLNQENSGFRARLKKLSTQLHGAPLADVSRVNSEVCRGIGDLLKEHQAEVRAIQEKYKARYGDSRVQKYVTAGATFLPTLAPTLQDQRQPTAAQPQDRVEPKLPTKKTESLNSLLGVLAIANES